MVTNGRFFRTKPRSFIWINADCFWCRLLSRKIFSWLGSVVFCPNIPLANDNWARARAIHTDYLQWSRYHFIGDENSPSNTTTLLLKMNTLLPTVIPRYNMVAFFETYLCILFSPSYPSFNSFRKTRFSYARFYYSSFSVGLLCSTSFHVVVYSMMEGAVWTTHRGLSLWLIDCFLWWNVTKCWT